METTKTVKAKRPRIGEPRGEKVTDNRKNKSSNFKTGPVSADMSVWKILNPLIKARNLKEQQDYLDFPFKSDVERIKFNTQKYKHMTITEAFEDGYGIKINPDIIDNANEIPSELTVGSVIYLSIASISKDNGVIFNSGNYKANFQTRNNLQSYEKLLNYTPNFKVPARILENRPNLTMVDVLSPMVEEYVMPYVVEPWRQNNIKNPQPIIVKNLHLIRGGYMGKAIIPNVSDFLGEEYEVDAFIPGSQIVLNTTSDFESFEGKDVKTFIMSYGPKPNGKGMSLVCSVKMYLKYLGTLETIKIYDKWCKDEQEWDNFSHTSFNGIVTGVINSSKKCGIFIEVPEFNITGMIPAKPEELTKFTAGYETGVIFTGFDEDLTYNATVDQYQHEDPFIIEDGCIKKVNIKPTLDFDNKLSV